MSTVEFSDNVIVDGNLDVVGIIIPHSRFGLTGNNRLSTTETKLTLSGPTIVGTISGVPAWSTLAVNTTDISLTELGQYEVNWQIWWRHDGAFGSGTVVSKWNQIIIRRSDGTQNNSIFFNTGDPISSGVQGHAKGHAIITHDDVADTWSIYSDQATTTNLELVSHSASRIWFKKI